MVEDVLLVVDASAPSAEVVALANSLLPRVAKVVVLQAVPQLPYAWTAWPAFPDTAEDLGRAWAYVSGVARGLEAHGWKASPRVHFSPLSAAEMDREILGLAQLLQPDLIFLALPKGSVRAGIVREAAVPVLVAKLSTSEEEAGGRRARLESMKPALASHRLLLNPAGALVFRLAGIL